MNIIKLADLPSLFYAKWVGLGAITCTNCAPEYLLYPLRIFEITLNNDYFYLFTLDKLAINDLTLLHLLHVFNSTYSFERPYYLVSRGADTCAGIANPISYTLFQNSKQIHPATIIQAMKKTLTHTFWQPRGGFFMQMKNIVE